MFKCCVCVRLLGRDRMRSLAHKQAQSQGHLLNPLWLSHINECYLSVKTNQLLLKKQSVHLKKFKLKNQGGGKGKKVRKPGASTGRQTDTHHFSELITPQVQPLQLRELLHASVDTKRTDRGSEVLKIECHILRVFTGEGKVGI